jgi:hypothetical protein
MDRTLTDFAGLRIHLRGRAGLEGIVRDEVEEAARKHGKFRVAEVRTGLVAVTPMAPFSPGDICALRCFDTVGFVLGDAGAAKDAEFVARLAAMITSPLSRRLLETFTEGSIRYRLDFVALGHQRGAVRLVVNRAYELCPEILNDARSAPWTIAVHPAGRGNMVELTPRFTPDPRLAFRVGDVPAASHPPLAACMARLAGQREDEIVWDPFCGSGLELIERHGPQQGGCRHFERQLRRRACEGRPRGIHVLRLPRFRKVEGPRAGGRHARHQQSADGQAGTDRRSARVDWRSILRRSYRARSRRQAGIRKSARDRKPAPGAHSAVAADRGFFRIRLPAGKIREAPVMTDPCREVRIGL